MSRTLKIFAEALEKRYGPSNTVDAQKAQVQAEGHRAMKAAAR